MSQRKAARFVFITSYRYSRYSSVTSMLNQLNWESLEQRRNKATIIMQDHQQHCICKLL